MASLVEQNICIESIKLKEAVRKKHLWEITGTLFEGDVWENISDVNCFAPIIHAWKRASLGEAVFLGISFNITTIINNFLQNLP